MCPPELTLANSYNPALAGRTQLSKDAKCDLNWKYYDTLNQLSSAISGHRRNNAKATAELVVRLKRFYVRGLSQKQSLFKTFILNRGVYKACGMWTRKKEYGPAQIPGIEWPVIAIVGTSESLVRVDPTLQKATTQWQSVYNSWFVVTVPEREDRPSHPRTPFSVLADYEEAFAQEKIEYSWEPVLTSTGYTSMSSIVAECFCGTEDVETKKLGGLPDVNPFHLILRGDVCKNVFEDAIDCLDNEQFTEMWRREAQHSKKDTKNPTQTKKKPVRKSRAIPLREPPSNKGSPNIIFADSLAHLKMVHHIKLSREGIAARLAGRSGYGKSIEKGKLWFHSEDLTDLKSYKPPRRKS